MNAHKDNFLAGIDVGASKCAVVIGATGEKGIHIYGVGCRPLYRVVREGFITNIDEAAQAIQTAIHEAEWMSNQKITHAQKVVIGVSSRHANSENVQSKVALDGQVTERALQQLYQDIRTRGMPAGENDEQNSLIHVLAQGYDVDHHTDLENPLDLCGSTLSMKAHVVRCENTPIRNLRNCLKRCHFAVRHIALEQIASSEAVLLSKDFEYGSKGYSYSSVCVADIGAETTKIVIYRRPHKPIHTSFIPLGGQALTDIIADTFATTPGQAEHIKLRYATVCTANAGDRPVNIPPMLDNEPARTVPRDQFAKCCQEYYLKLFKQIAARIEESGVHEDIRSLVLTGGGSQIENLSQSARANFPLPRLHIRVAQPHPAYSITPAIYHPRYATAVGLLYSSHWSEQHHRVHNDQYRDVSDAKRLDTMWKGLIGKVRHNISGGGF